jgi:hypothetical protein
MPTRVWVCLGTFPDNHVLSREQGTLLAGYVAAGVSVYVEGADAWAFDPITEFHDYNGVDEQASLDGDDSFTAIQGHDFATGLFSGITAAYNQDQTTNDFTDQLITTATDIGGPNAGVVWSHPTLLYATGVLHDGERPFGTTLCQSWEFGGFAGDAAQLAAALVSAMPDFAGGLFRRGDANVDGTLNVADVVRLLAYLLVGGTEPLACLDAADSNDDGTLNIADAIQILNVLFVTGTVPLPPPGSRRCGPDGSLDLLTCDADCP